MGQVLSSCAPCCSDANGHEDVQSYQKAVPNDKNPQWKEKIETNENKIILAVDPKSTEEEVAAARMKIMELEFLKGIDRIDEMKELHAEAGLEYYIFWILYILNTTYFEYYIFWK